MRHVIACSLLALSPPAFAATEFTDSVPLRLVQSLVGNPFGSQTRIYQDLPDDFPALDFPAEFTLLGSMDMGISQTAVLAVPEGISDAQSRLGQALEDAGWKSLPLFTSSAPGAGFVSAGAQSQPVPSRYCHDDESGSVSLNVPEEGILAVSRQRGEAFLGGVDLTCAEQIEQSSQQRFMGGSPGGISDYTPRLEKPEAANQDMGIRNSISHMGGGGSPFNDWEIQDRMTLDWSLQDLLAHFAPQLEAQGWTPEGSGTAGFLASSTGAATSKTVRGYWGC